MSGNYVIINGEKIALTDEECRSITIRTEKKTPFSRVGNSEPYYYINASGVSRMTDKNTAGDQGRYDTANYCTDQSILLQQFYRETLNRLLWRYSKLYRGDKIQWSRFARKWYLVYRKDLSCWCVSCHRGVTQSVGTVYFIDKSVAYDAIERIVKPFMEDHPDFVI